MPHFILICHDGPDGRTRRAETRPDHLDHIERQGAAVKIAGPLLDADNGPVGSLFLLEMENEEAVARFAAEDPYARAGVFERTEIRPFRVVVDTLSK